jgi:MFS family permease
MGVLDSLSYRSFRMYWSGAFISSIGSWLQVAAVLWFVRSIGSDTLVGFVNMVAWVPTLFLGLFAGAVADRMDRRRVILISQAVMLVCSILIGLSIDLPWVHDLTLIVFLGISGIAYALFVMAWVATIPVLVPKEALLSAVTLNNVQFNLARFFGPLLGGWLLLVASDQIPFYLNASTFGAFMLMILISRAELPPARPRTESVGACVLEGFRYVRDNSWMVTVLAVVCGLSFFGFSFMVLIPSVCKQILGVSDHAYGFLLGMTGLGALGGMLAVAFLKPRVGLKAMMGMGAFLTAAFLLAFSASSAYWLSCLLAAGAGGSFVLCNAAAGAALQGNVTPEMQGRVSSLWVVAYVGTFPVGGLLLGYLSDALSLKTSLVIAALACAAVAAFAFLFVVIPGD